MTTEAPRNSNAASGTPAVNPLDLTDRNQLERSATMRLLRTALLRFTLLAVVVTVVSLAGAAAASADGPTIVTTSRYIAPSNAAPITAACGFTVLQTATLYSRQENFTDATGNLVLRRTHLSFEGHLIKASTGEAIPWDATWTQTLDVAAGTITIDGMRQEIQSPGQPPAAMMVGHLVIPSNGSLIAIDESTQADFFDFFSEVCPAFS